MGRLYTKYKIFHFKEKIDSLLADDKRILPPVHIRIKPTNVCNHRCHYCAYRKDGLQLGQDMRSTDYIPKAKMLEVIDDIIAMEVKAVTFSGGGEPFCYPHLLEVVKKLSSSAVKFACLTNGSRLTGELAELFARHGSWVRISMDGYDEESYSRYRDIPPGGFSSLITNIAAFKSMGGPCQLGVSYIVDKDNRDRVFDMVRQLKDLGVDSVKVSPCIVSNSGSENNRYHSSIFTEVKKQIDRALQSLAGPEFEIFDAYHQLDEKFEKKYSWCPVLQILTVIGADMNVYSCHDKAYNLDTGCMGSIAHQSLKALWHADKSAFFRINPSRDCRHHCADNAKNMMLHEYLEINRDHLEFV